MLELITGGSGSGKSEYAEKRAMELCGDGEPLIYLAAMKPYGEDAQKRIERHRKLRKGKGFKTIEKYTDYANLRLPENATVLLECMSNLLANEMFDAGGAFIDRIITGVGHLANSSKNLVIVTNDVFSDGVSYDEETEQYIQALSEINKHLADKAERVVEVVYSIPCIIRGEQLACEL